MITFDGEKLVVSIDEGNINAVMTIADENRKDCEYSDETRSYRIPITKKNARFLVDNGFELDDSVIQFFKNCKRNRDVSLDEIDVDRIKINESLYPFQIEGVRRLISDPHNMLLADDMGLGKSVQIAEYLRLSRQFPCVIVCPASLKLNWKREIEKWTEVKAYILCGKESYELTDELLNVYSVIIINYDILGIEDKEEKKKIKAEEERAKELGVPFRKRNANVYGWCDEICMHNFKTVVCDECQAISEPDTIRSRAVRKICLSTNTRKIFLSGTPYETRTSQFFSALNLIAPEIFSNRWKFLMTYCNPKKTFFGWTFNGLTNGEELNRKIQPFMIRRLKKDVLKELPPKVRTVIPLMITPKERKIYDDADNVFFRILTGKSEAKEESNPLTRLIELKKACFQSKKNAVKQWIKDFLEYNDKLVLFIYHKESFRFFMDEFKNICVGINGETPMNERQKSVDEFQKNPKVRLFVGQIKACNSGLTLTSSSTTCFAEFGTTAVQHEQAEDRVHRISQKADSVNAYYLIMENSIDEDIMETLNSRNADLKKVMNGEDNVEMFAKNFAKDILKKYKQRKKKEN